MTAKDLKNALLQEAVQGRLVPQIAAEGCAKDLLDKIKTESSLRSKSQIRVTKKELLPVTAEEIPFDIPENWCWCRLGEITTILGDGIHGTPEYDVNGEYYFVNGNNLSNGKIEIKPDTKKVNLTEYEKYKKQLNENTVLISINGTLGNLAFYNNEKIILGKSACYFNLVLKEMKNYIFYILKTKYFNDYAESEATKTTIRNVSLGAMRNLLIPLPPLAEQKRIVAAIEKFMPLIEEYGKKETELNLLNAKIGALTKKAILQEAVQGRLVPQIAAEGNARDLLEEIKKNHTDLQISTKSADAKSDLRSKSQIRVTKKELPPVTAEEIPFDIPENWCWCRLGDVCKFLSRGKSPVYSEIRKYPIFAQKCNLKDGEISLEQAQFLDPEVLPKWKEEYKILDGDILVNSTGTGTVMRTRYFKSEYLGNYPFVMPDSHVTVIRTFENIDSKYLYYCCRDFTVQNYWKENLAGSTNQKELYIGVVGNTLIPLPPLAEQKRIVEAIEQLLPLCKKLGQ